MQTPQQPPRMPGIPCWACHARLEAPIWMYTGDGQHQPCCPSCLLKIDESFTPEAAITQALFDVWIWSDAPVKPHYRRQERTLRRVGAR